MTKRKKIVVGKFEVRFKFAPDEKQPCVATIDVEIKADEQREIPYLLESPNVSISGQTLLPSCGITREKDGKIETRVICGDQIAKDNWEAVAEAVEEEKEKIQRTLEEVYGKNKKLDETKLQDYDEKLAI